MLKSHMEAVENSLVQISQIPANSGHTLHRGTPREAFIKEFLEDHLSANVAIGTGEIIDSKSKPREKRNQFDIVIYKRNYPKIHFGGGVNGFLIESVVATIEVKSILDAMAIDQSVRAAHGAKNLSPNVTRVFTSGWIPPKILSYVVAYQGPSQMKTAFDWIVNAHLSNKIPLPNWTEQSRTDTPGTALDGVFLLQKGFVKLDNSPLTLKHPSLGSFPSTHTVCDSQSGSLLMLFLALQEACNNVEGAWLDAIPYLQTAGYQNVAFV